MGKMEYILNLVTGECFKADDLLNKSRKEVFILRRKLEVQIQKNNLEFVCAVCTRAIKLRAGLERTVHFSHLADSKYCPVKTDTNYTKTELLKLRYHGIRESQKHIDMKSNIEKVLKLDKRFSSDTIIIEGVIKDFKEKLKWKKPDIQCEFNNRLVVFEIQISHTFLSEIVARDLFYNTNEIPIYWVCDDFYPEFDYLKVFQCDILYHHNCNVFVFDDTAYNYSLENKRLTFNVYWLEPYEDKNKVIQDKWCNKLVDISEIKYDEQSKKLFYSNYEEKLMEYKCRVKKEKVFDIIRNSKKDELFYWLEKFRNEINQIDEFNLPIWNEENDIDSLFLLFVIFLSIRENKIYYYKVGKLKELLNLFNVRDRNNPKAFYKLFFRFVENGNYEKPFENSKFEEHKKNYSESNIPQSDKYTEYLRWFFEEI